MLKKIPDHVKAFVLFLTAVFLYSVKTHAPSVVAAHPTKEYLGYITLVLVFLSVVIVIDMLLSFFRKKSI